MNNSGKYIAYYTSLEGSTIKWSDSLPELQAEWCFGMAIFESNGFTREKLKEIFPEPPERGVILDYFTENFKLAFQQGALIGKIITTREVLTEKINNK